VTCPLEQVLSCERPPREASLSHAPHGVHRNADAAVNHTSGMIKHGSVKVSNVTVSMGFPPEAGQQKYFQESLRVTSSFRVTRQGEMSSYLKAAD
jgi:hypothetical protein